MCIYAYFRKYRQHFKSISYPESNRQRPPLLLFWSISLELGTYTRDYIFNIKYKYIKLYREILNINIFLRNISKILNFAF